jgi:hypothetical protein
MTTWGTPGVGVVVGVGDAVGDRVAVGARVGVEVEVTTEVEVAVGWACTVGTVVAVRVGDVGAVGRGAIGAMVTVCETVGVVIGVMGKSGRSVAVGAKVPVGVVVSVGPSVVVTVGCPVDVLVGGVTGGEVRVGVFVITTLEGWAEGDGGPWAKESVCAGKVSVATIRVMLITSGNRAAFDNRLIFMAGFTKTFGAPSTCPRHYLSQSST